VRQSSCGGHVVPGGAGIQEEFLTSRRRELETRARDSGLEVDPRLEGLDTTDDRLVVAALGTLLGLPIRQVFDESVRVDELERSANELARRRQVLEAEAEHWQELRDRLGREGALED